MPIEGEIQRTITAPENVTIELTELTRSVKVIVKGPQGTLTRDFSHPRINLMKQTKNELTLYCRLPRSQEKAMVGTWEAHLNNMIIGVTEGFEYKLKIVYSHFPMRATVKGKTFNIDNFMGEKHPRYAKIVGDTTVKVSGDQVIVSGINREDVGQTAANIELATRIKGYDPRIFQDGIYIVSKGKGS